MEMCSPALHHILECWSRVSWENNGRLETEDLKASTQLTAYRTLHDEHRGRRGLQQLPQSSGSCRAATAELALRQSAVARGSLTACVGFALDADYLFCSSRLGWTLVVASRCR